MRVTITIDTDNAAFEDAGFEVAVILRQLAGRFDFASHLPAEGWPIRDHNGNTVGEVRIE
jgi:hypothetical protein